MVTYGALAFALDGVSMPDRYEGNGYGATGEEETGVVHGGAFRRVARENR